MIYLSILLDILIYNYSSFNSYFFIRYLYNKNILYYICSGLFLDIIIFHSILVNTIILIIIYYINILFRRFNKDNLYIYLINLLFSMFIYIFITNIINYNSIYNIFILIGNSLFINILFYIISYKSNNKLI